jgi:predicted Zn-dependent protease
MDVAIGNSGVSSARYIVHRSYNNQLQRIGNSLLHGVSENDKKGYKFEFKAIKETYVNAFAYPGGKIFITDQMIEDLELSDGEIAAVLAHEIGHVLNRHSIKRIIEQSIVGIAFAACFYEDPNDNDGERDSFGEKIGKLIIKNAVMLGSLSFSRLHEYEADNAGWEAMVLSNAGYKPDSMITLFQKLMKLTSDDGTTHWHSTHPGTKDRIDALLKKCTDSTCKVDIKALDPEKLKQPTFKPQTSKLEF